MGPQVCHSCAAGREQRRASAASELTRARFEVRKALDEVQRLKDIYVAVPKPSSDGDLAIRLAQRTYESAASELSKAWIKHIEAFNE
jgi:hypothetical protein